MTIFVRDVVSENFVRIIPKFLEKRVLDKISENNYVAMQDYLQKTYGISLQHIIKELFIKGFSYSKVKNLYIVRINDSIRETKSQEKLSTLVRLIDYGNSEVRGINLFGSAVNYIRGNILNIYKVYQMKGGD